MAIRQLSIFLENRVGRLAEITRILGQAGVDILAISVADTTDFGILRLLVDDVDKAVESLKSQGVVCSVNTVTVVSVDGVPGGLAKVLGTLDEAGINVEYMYTVSQKKSTDPLMVFRFAGEETALAALRKAGLKVLDATEL